MLQTHKLKSKKSENEEKQSLVELNSGKYRCHDDHIITYSSPCRNLPLSYCNTGQGTLNTLGRRLICFSNSKQIICFWRAGLDRKWQVNVNNSFYYTNGLNLK
jgi:hypothetical protein